MFVYVTLQQLSETKQLKSQVRCGEMGNRIVKKHMVNHHNSFAGIIYQTRSNKLDTRQTCDCVSPVAKYAKQTQFSSQNEINAKPPAPILHEVLSFKTEINPKSYLIIHMPPNLPHISKFFSLSPKAHHM